MRLCSPSTRGWAACLRVALTAVMESYLPIVRAFFLLVWTGSPALRERLIQRIEAALHPEDSIFSRARESVYPVEATRQFRYHRCSPVLRPAHRLLHLE